MSVVRCVASELRRLNPAWTRPNEHDGLTLRVLPECRERSVAFERSAVAMNLRQLKYFVGIVEAGNITRAADAMNVAQTALSAQLRHLEADLGVPLLVRHSRGIEPTAAGRLLYARGQALLRHVEDVRREVVSLAGDDIEAVRFGLTPALMLAIGADLIDLVHETVPRISFSLVEAMSHVLVGNMLAGDLDYALCYDATDQPQLARRALLQEDLVFVTKPGPERRRQIRLIEVLDETLAMPDAADTVRVAVARAARDLGRDLVVAYEVRSIAAMKSLAMRGTASCVLPLASVSAEARSSLLLAVPIVQPPVRRMLYLVSSNQTHAKRCDLALMMAVETALGGLVAMLGRLAHPLWSLPE